MERGMEEANSFHVETFNEQNEEKKFRNLDDSTAGAAAPFVLLSCSQHNIHCLWPPGATADSPKETVQLHQVWSMVEEVRADNLCNSVIWEKSKQIFPRAFGSAFENLSLPDQHQVKARALQACSVPVYDRYYK